MQRHCKIRLVSTPLGYLVYRERTLVVHARQSNLDQKRVISAIITLCTAIVGIWNERSMFHIYNQKMMGDKVLYKHRRILLSLYNMVLTV